MGIRALWLGASALTLVWCGGAAAQTAGRTGASTPPASDGAGASVSEVVVTGERRTTNLQTTAIAATVLNQDDLLRQGVTTIDQLQFVSPSLTVNNFGQGNNVNIRGIGKGEHNSQTGTGVVTYRDGAATFPGYFAEEPYYDVSSVEVLRGPQGTFSGQNATGGAIIVNTQDPKINGGYTGYLLGHYGNYNDTGAQGAVNLPINDTLAARVALNAEYHDTWYNLNGLKSGDPDIKWLSGRFSLLWQPTPELKILFKEDLSYLDNGGYFGDSLTAPDTDHLFDINTNYGTYAVDKLSRSTLKIDYTLPDALQFRSVTSYQVGRTAWKGDIDGTALPVPNYVINEASDETLWSQEFNLISPANRPFSWILGFYYQSNDYDYPSFNVGVPPGVVDTNLVGVNNTHNFAGFGQASYNFGHGLELQAGLRYSTWSTTNHTTYFVPEFGSLLTQRQDESKDGNNFTGKVALNWTIDDDNFVYAFVASGAKPGGLNTSVYAFPPVPIPAPFKQEYVTDYEVGWKARFFDRHLRTQVGFFYNQFEDFQVIVPIPNDPLHATELNNPSTTVLYGGEASAQAVFGDLTFKVNAAVQHSELGRVFASDSRILAIRTPCNLDTGPASATCTNLEGHTQTYAPNITGNMVVQYDIRLANGDVISPSANFAYISHQWGTLFQNRAAGDYLAARKILGASLAWTHGPFTATAYGYNLTNDQYVSALLSPIRIAGAPRQFGVSLMRRF